MAVTWTIMKGGPTYDFLETLDMAVSDKVVDAETQTKVVFEVGNSKVVFLGSFLYLDGNPGPDDGEVNAIKIFQGGVLLATATGYTLDVDDFDAPFSSIPGDFGPFHDFLFDNPGETPLFFMGSPDRDVFTAGGIATEVYGKGGKDTLTGNDAAEDYLSGGGGADVLVGLGDGDTLIGGKGDDKLTGGKADDFLTGGKGADWFTFATGPSLTDFDNIEDFKSGIDTIRLDAALYTGIGAFLTADEFHLGSEAETAKHSILYDSATGLIYWDVDGVGGTDALEFASVGAGTTLTHSDFAMF
jgi:Ca2+-binding RTX toxin-like protein